MDPSDEAIPDSAPDTLNALALSQFDEVYYQRSYPDLPLTGINYFEHYLTTGWLEGRNPSDDFDTTAYFLRSALTHPNTCPLLHFVHASATKKNSDDQDIDRRRLDGFVALARQSDYFDPDYYEGRYPDVTSSGLVAEAHYFVIGWKEGRNPSVAFETSFYAASYMLGALKQICPLEHFLLFGLRRGALPSRSSRAPALCKVKGKAPHLSMELQADVPAIIDRILTTPFFDVDYYLKTYDDVARSGADPAWHYLIAGWRENRSPSATFSSAYYIEQYLDDPPSIAPLLHYAAVGVAYGIDTSKKDAQKKQLRTYDALWADGLLTILLDLGFKPAVIDDFRLRHYVAPMFSAANYRLEMGLSSQVSDITCFLRYVTQDLTVGMSPGPLFNSEHFVSEATKRHLPYGQGSFLDWLDLGVENDLSPFPFFDSKEYLALNSDLANHPGPLIGHFLREGIGEGRQFSQILTFNGGVIDALELNRSALLQKFLLSVSGQSNAPTHMQQMSDFRSSGRLQAAIQEAVGLDPEVALDLSTAPSYLAPWHDSDYSDYEYVRAALGSAEVDYLILVPFCKLGGADLVAGFLTRTLSERGSVLVVQTDRSDWDRPDWFPTDVRRADISKLVAPLTKYMRKRTLYESIVAIRPKAVYNVNSRLGFEVFDGYGARLAAVTDLYAYYFCADRDSKGNEVGYPVSYFSNIFPHLKEALVDSASLARELSERYTLAPEDRVKVRTIYTPAMGQPNDVIMASSNVKQDPTGNRPLILWAGRFDRQKRFDLVVEIARNMPDVDFEIWGKAVLDAEPDLNNLPENLRVNPPFANIQDLPLADANGWLYTSSWDGIPTLLIELASLGMPIVASAVGGVPELIDERTGWPVHPNASLEEYCDTIRSMLSEPDERLARTSRLKQRASLQHNLDTYAQAIGGGI